MLPRHVTEQARAYFVPKYNMLHFITLKVKVPASIGFWIAKIRLVKGIPPKTP